MEKSEVLKDLKELYDKYWNDDYVAMLSIIDTMSTALEKYKLYKLQRISKEELEKELSNLFILLNLYLINNENSWGTIKSQIESFKTELKYKELIKSETRR